MCSRCKSTFYCSRTHQKEHWKHHKTRECNPDSAPQSSGAVAATAVTAEEGGKSLLVAEVDPVQRRKLFPEYSLVVEPEELDDEAELAKSAQAMSTAHIWDDAGAVLYTKLQCTIACCCCCIVLCCLAV